MYFINRVCTQKGHEQELANNLCTYRGGYELYRWLCQYCIWDVNHGHSMPNSNHIMTEREFLSRVQWEMQNLKQQYLSSKQVNNQQAFLQHQMKHFKELGVIDNRIFYEDTFELNNILEIGVNTKKYKNK